MAADQDKPVAVVLGTHPEGLVVAQDIRPGGLVAALDIHLAEVAAVAQDTYPEEPVVGDMPDYFEDTLNKGVR